MIPAAARRTAPVALLAALFWAAALPVSAEAPVLVAPGLAAAFRILAPAEVRAGEPFALEVVALDASGNVVVDYDRTGGGAALRAEGGGAVAPARLEPSVFRNGAARVEAVLSAAGACRILARDPTTAATGASAAVRVLAGPPARFEIVVPAGGRVGEEIPVEIAVRDSVGNLVVDYQRTGRPVALRPTGTGGLRPGEVSPSAFVGGTARLAVLYDAAEEVALVASAGAVEGRSAPLRVRAGPLHEFRLTAPSSGRAGEYVRIAIEARDAAGNSIEEFRRTGAPVALRHTGRGRLEPSTVAPDAFRDGVAAVHVRYDVAEEIRITAVDAGGARTGTSGPIAFAGGAVERFEVAAPNAARAGDPFEAQIWAYDAFGNLVRDSGGRLRPRVRAGVGALAETPAVAPDAFRDGVAVVRVVPRTAGTLVLDVADDSAGAAGRSREIAVAPGSAAAFTVEAPASARANEPFEVEVAALDAMGNVAKDFDRSGAVVRLRAEGAGEILPAEVPASTFLAGRARLVATHDAAETMRVLVEAGGGPRGRSGVVDVRAGALAFFAPMVRTETRAFAAGAPIPLRIKACDRYGNVVRDYAATGRGVEVAGTGAGSVTPAFVEAVRFRGGIADVEFVAVAAETFRLRVREAGATAEGRTPDVTIRPAAPSRLGVTLPAEVRAGEEVPVRVEVRDRFGNLVSDYARPSISLSIRAEGFRVGAGAVPPVPFRGGVAVLEIVPKSVGEGRLVVSDAASRLRGVAESVRVLPGPVHRFEVLLPEAIRAGEPTRAALRALDAEGNVVEDFGRDGAGVRLTASGSGLLLPPSVSGGLFSNGRADLFILYDRAEPLSIRAEPLPSGGAEAIVAAVPWPSAGGARLALLSTGPIEGATCDRPAPLLAHVFVPGLRLAPGAVARGGVEPIAEVSLEEAPFGGEGVAAAPGVRAVLRLDAPVSPRLQADRNLLAVSFDEGYINVLTVGPGQRPEAGRTEAAPIAPAVPPTGGGAVGAWAPHPAPGGRADLEEANARILSGEYSAARGIVLRRLAAAPDDADAAALLRRLDVLLGIGGVIGAAAPGVAPVARPPAVAPVAAPDRRPPSPGTWDEIEWLIRSGRFRDALRALDVYRAAHPEEERASRTRGRIERLVELERTR